MEPTDPTDPKGVTIGDVEAEPSSAIPSVQRGEPTTLEVRLQFLGQDGESQSDRYHHLKRYQEYAGEASYNNELGGKPTLREHPQDYWPVDSHVVPIVFGDEIYETPDVWALIDGVDDSNTQILAEPEPLENGYGDSYGDSYGGERLPSPNHYVLAVEIVPLADLEEYDDREKLLADLSPVLNQM